MSIMNGKPCTSRGVSTVWEGLCANLSSKDDKAAHCYLTKESSFLHLRKKTYSVHSLPRFRHQVETVKSLLSRRRVRHAGSKRKRHIPSPMTLSDRLLSPLTRSVLRLRSPRNFLMILFSTCLPTLQRNLQEESAQRKRKRSSSVTVRASLPAFLLRQAVRKTVRPQQVQLSLLMM